MMVQLNDQPRPVAAGATLLDLLGELDLVERRGVAVAVNDALVPRGEWPGRALLEADRVLVIQAAQGG